MELDNQKVRDARVEKLWQTLDTQKEGHLDVKGLKKGLKKIDHRSFSVTLNFGAANRMRKLLKMPTICFRMS